MLPLVGGLADAANGQTQSRLQGVEQRRFTDAALPGDDGLTSLQTSPEPIESHAADGAGQERRNAELAVVADERLMLGRINQIGLVEAKDRPDAALRGAGQIAVDQVRFEI